MTDPTTLALLDLAALRKIAEAATPGPWQAVEAHWPHYTMIVISNEGKDYTGFGVSCVNLMSDNAEHNTTHIAAFDPPTVLRLIELAESGVPTAVVQELKEPHS